MLRIAAMAIVLGPALLVGPLGVDRTARAEQDEPAATVAPSRFIGTADPAPVAQPPTTTQQDAQAPDPDGSGGPPPRADVLPGITIDKARRRVMVACRSLRPGGPLELIACTPNTREHEAVLLVRARPQNIHLALLLCGFEKGRPARWDERTEQGILPTGDPVDVQVQWLDPKTRKERTAPIEEWLATVDPAGKVPKLKFLFTGSEQFEDGRYWADLEGSVVSLSNFPDSVVDLSGEHSRDNAMLEFKGNADTMPPPETGCTMVLLPPASMVLRIEAGGGVNAWGRAVAPRQLPDALKAHRLSRDDARISLTVAPGVAAAEVDTLIELCRQAGFDKDRIDRVAPSTTQPADRP